MTEDRKAPDGFYTLQNNQKEALHTSYVSQVEQKLAEVQQLLANHSDRITDVTHTLEAAKAAVASASQLGGSK